MRISRRRGACHGALVGVFALGAACGEENGESADPVADALRTGVDETIIPAMETFAAEATAMEEQAEALCSEPTETGLTTLRDQWLELSFAWNRAAVWFLGPLDDDLITPSMIFIESMRQRGIDYVDTVRETIAEALTDSIPLDAAYFEGLAFNRVGIVALEVLLFDDGTEARSTALADVLAALRGSPRRCTYLEGMARLLGQRARGVAAGWTESFGSTGVPFRDQLLAGELEDGSDPVVAVILSVVSHLEYVRRRKLEGVMDARLAGAARPEAAPFFQNIAASLDAMKALMEAPGGGTGFFDAMEARGFSGDVETVRASFAEAEAAITEARDRGQAAEDFLELETNFRREVPLALGVDLGINFSDGD